MPEAPQPTSPVEVFYSYAHKDEKLKDELLKHLSNIERQGMIISWHDRKITAGREWAGTIDEHINTAGLILLLVSPDFMSSGYCNDVELKRAMQRHEATEARVIPVILRPVDSKGAPFDKLRALPTDGRPITRRRNRDAALLEVAQGIREAVDEFVSRPASTTPLKTREPIIPRPPVVGFVARRDEQGRDIIGRLKEELAPEDNRLVALWGPGGVGKSTLVAEFIRATQNAFKGRVAWVSALGRSEFSLATLLDEVATQLGREDLRKLAPEPKAAQVGTLVSESATLVVLDNFETVSEEEQARCLDFLAQAAACPALITTRSFINREDVYNIALAAMSSDEARDFLQRLVERTRKPSNFDRLDRDDLIRRCEANPLVLQWVVRQIDLAKRPQDVLEDLSRGEGDAAERVFTRSFNLPRLGDDGRAALLAISLFTPDASREALAEVSVLGDLRRVSKAVEKLSALWLVDATEGNERLFLRGLTRELAKARLSKDDKAAEARARYVDFFKRYAHAHAQETPEEISLLEAEKDNLLGAMDMALGLGDWGGVMEIRQALYDFFYVRGYWDEGVRSGGQAETAARAAGDDWHVAYFAMCAAKIRRAREEYEATRRTYLEALEIYKRLGDEGQVAFCLHNLGNIEQSRRNLTEARRFAEASLEIKKRLDDKNGIAYSLHQLGNISYLQGDLNEARRYYNESLEFRKTLSKPRGIASTKTRLGVVAMAQGDLDMAQQLLNESLVIRKQLGSRRAYAIVLRDLGRLKEKQGHKAEARRLLRESWCILEQLRSPEAERVREHLDRVNAEADEERGVD